MVVMDRLDYLNKAQQLFADQDTYSPITLGCTTRLKHKLISTLRNITPLEDLMTVNIKDYIQPVQFHPCFMESLYTKTGTPQANKGHPCPSLK